MSLTTALNLFWGFLAVIALALFADRERRRSRISRKHGQLRRFSAVVLVTVALFPCISASDDIIGLATLTSRGSQNSTAEDKASAQLASVLQSLENLQITPVFSLVFALSFFGLVSLSWHELRGRRIPVIAGRGPPRV